MRRAPRVARIFLLLSLATGITLAAAVSNEQLAAVDAVFAEFDSTHSPGCALGVVRDDELVVERGYGMASLEHGIPNSSRAVYYIGSTSKQFVAASILLAAEQGHLSLDDDIRQYVPELPEWEKPITVRHLVHHTSGLRDYLTLMFLADMPAENVWRRDQIIAMLVRQRALNFEPGSEYLYSNSGYFLMAEIVERATGKSLRRFARENIFAPLGMNASHFHDDRTMIVENRAAAYAPREEGGFELRWYLNFEQVGSGGLLTTVRDLARWDANFYDDRLGEGTLVEAMQQAGRLNDGEELDYAFGLSIGEHRGLRTVDHGGAFMGFRAQLLRFPDQRFSVICLCNTANSNPGGLSLEVAEIFLSDLMEAEPETTVDATAEDAPAGIDLSEEQLGRWVGAYRGVESGLFRRIRIEDGKLVYVRSEDNKTELAPQAENRFVMLGIPTRVVVEFEPIAGGNRPRMVVTVSDSEVVTFDPVEAATPDAAALAAYAGHYYSPELDVVYRLEVEDGELVLGVGSSAEPRAVQPTVVDEFVGDGFSVEFRREEGQVTGFTVDAGRVRGLLFERQGSTRP